MYCSKFTTLWVDLGTVHATQTDAAFLLVTKHVLQSQESDDFLNNSLSGTVDTDTRSTSSTDVLFTILTRQTCLEHLTYKSDRYQSTELEPSGYTPWAIKKRATLFGIITSMFRNGFLHFLHQWKQEKMLYRGITKFATLPQLCLNTTWENLKTHTTAHFETNCQCILMLNTINGKNESKWTVSSSC